MTALELFSASFTPHCLERGGSVSISSLTGAADAFLALSLAARPTPRIVLAVTDGIPAAESLFADLKILTNGKELGREGYATRVHLFPPSVADDKSALGLRLKTIAAIRAWEISPHPAVIVAPFQALASAVPQKAPSSIKITPSASFRELVEKIPKLGYRRMGMVECEGDWAVRGGIIDIWSPGEEFPVRAEFFGDELESLRSFECATQRSLELAASAEIIAVSEEKGEDASHLSTLAHILPHGSTLLALDHNSYNISPYVTEAFSLCVYTGDPAPQGVPAYTFQTAPLPGFGELGVEKSHHPEIFEAARERLERHLAASEKRNVKILRIDNLSKGFEILGPSGGLIVVAKADRVFTKRAGRIMRKLPPQRELLTSFDELEIGEYVVHIDYGVGRFIGSSEILMDSKRTEVFTIEYADGAKLHVNATQAHLLSRYVGVKGQEVTLHSLDGKKWKKDRIDAEKSVVDLASALLRTQAQRETAPGFAYDVNCEGKEAFEAAFPYEETPDQLAAIKAIESDLASTKPMDRLICGDAGYGKTEVAMRAAFIAAMNGKQTAVLAPTTVLAEQHFETFTSRFDGTAVRIESLSRFQSAKTHAGTFERLKSGVCDIVIGTHALLSAKASFKDLGLIIIDEEQRFGVRHKEFLKRLRATADVLTLSATPIPRTLYLSMTGARDLSPLSTPPRERTAVETTVVRDSDIMVRAAIEAEIARGGQVFFLYNRVSTMGRVEKRLKEICPEARVITAHGQMDSKELARRMRKFEQGQFDILLSTTIIESGIDIPRANTIIISDAHMFGLADLYQLRGRVGRSTRQGHAVLLLPAEGPIDSDARERIDALKRHGGLGSGFQLAVRDLELRGAGNLLGAQQSGHIAAVGFSLYCQLLKRTIQQMKGEKPKEVINVKLSLDFIVYSPSAEDDSSAAAIPYSYIEEDSQRIGFMKRYASAMENREIDEIRNELTDRFGRLPEPVVRLHAIAKLRIKCAKGKIGQIITKGRKATLYRAGTGEILSVHEFRSASADGRIKELSSLVTATAQKRETE